MNLESLSGSLKYSYQQLCKQDVEEREHSRQFLVKLQKFEGKSLDLGAHTYNAQKSLHQYEKMMMQQNPLLWAQVQQSLASDNLKFDLQSSLYGNYGMKLKKTREVASNTGLESSSTSDQDSSHEGIWPNSPSPYPDLGVESLTAEVPVARTQHSIRSSTPNFKNHLEKQHLKPTIPDISIQPSIPATKEHLNSINTTQLSSPRHEDANQINTQTELILTNEVNPLTPQKIELPLQEINLEPSNATQESQLKIEIDPVQENPKKKEKEEPIPESIEYHVVSNPVQEADKFPSVIPEAPQQILVINSPPPEVTIKPFQLESDSESAAADLISGPRISAAPAADEDSDSFWN